LGLAALLIGAGVLGSRILGYVRDAVIAAQHGAGADTDVYFASFTVPDLMKYMLDGGALSLVFIPMIADMMHGDREDEAWDCFGVVATTVFVVACLATVGLWLAAPTLVPLLVPGFDAEQIAQTVSMTRIVLPGQIFFMIGGLLNATLQVRERFVETALAGLVYNGFIIAGGLILGPSMGIAGFSWGALAGAIGQCALFGNAARRQGLVLRPRFSLTDPHFVRFFKQSIPVLLGFSLVAADEWISRWFASGMAEGSISWIQNARRLMLVPISVLGFATSQAALPFLSKLHAEGKPAEAAQMLADTVRIVAFVCALAAGWLAVAAEPIIGLFFERGAYDAVDTVQTAGALFFFALGVVFWGMYSLVGRGFYAMQDTWTPMLLATGVFVVCMPIYATLGEAMGHRGLALSTTIGMMLTVAALLLALHRKTPLPLGAMAISIARSMGIAGAAGGAAWAVDVAVGLDGYLLRGVLVSAVYGVLALGAAFVLRVNELDAVAGGVLRRLRR
jgi:putative peptidoglycan lipid II flippase